MEMYQNNWCFEQIYNFRTLIYHEKLWYLSKNDGTMGKKIRYFTEKYGPLINYGKTMLLK